MKQGLKDETNNIGKCIFKMKRFEVRKIVIYE